MSELLRISELIRNQDSFTFSFEVTPDVGEAELDKITLHPKFYSITWHALSHQCKDLNIAPLKLANLLRQKHKHVLLNLSCNLMTKAYLNDLLPWLQEKGICNLFIVLGDSFNPNRSDFKTSSEMISYIKSKTSDYFCIGVAGFPYDDCKITALKEKIDLGADFIISQAFFEADIYKNYLEKCKDENIDVPIIPGIFPFQSQKELDMFLKLCKVKVSEEFKMKLEGKSENVMDIIENLVLDLRNNLNVKHFHFFTINKLGITCDLVKKIQLSL